MIGFVLESPGIFDTLRLRMVVDGETVEAAADRFEEALPRLELRLPHGMTVMCCYTCLYSDYSPLGHGIFDMDCHRGAKEQYLAVKSKREYFRVPRTEEVMEIHLCPDYERRIPGTGYRG